MDKCPFCEKDDGNYDMSRVCCAARYLGTQNLVGRREYLARWEKKHGSAATATLKATFTGEWKIRNK